MIIYTTENEIVKLANENKSYILEGNKMQTRDTLFFEISNKLKFPDYFGNNWDALDECLQDLEWIEDENINIVIKDYGLILHLDHSDEKTIFMSCIKDADEFWSSDGTKTINFYISNKFLDNKMIDGDFSLGNN